MEMCEKINQEFEKYQRELRLRSMHIKLPVNFIPDNMDDIIKELRNKEIKL